MKTTKKKVLALDYYQNFKCIGSDCESNCCHSWRIMVDGESYRKYQELDNINNDDFFKHITPITDKKNKTVQFIIELNEQKQCPYLTSDNLCGMITKHGLDSQCYVCRIYPRKARVALHSGTPIHSCSLSCPEVVRKAILREAPLKIEILFNKIEPVSPEMEGTFNDISGEHRLALERIHQNFIKIIQKRETSLEKRFTALLLLSSMANKLNCATNINDASRFREECDKMVSSGIESLPDLQANTINQFDQFLKIMEGIIHLKKYTDTPAVKDFFSIVDKAFLGFKLKTFNEADTEHLLLYQQALATYILPVLEKWPHIFENLAAHHIMTSSFPFTKGRTPLDNFTHYIVIQVLLRGLIAGYAAHKGQLTQQDITHIITVTYRTLEHDRNIVESINNINKQLNGATLGQLFTLFAL